MTHPGEKEITRHGFIAKMSQSIVGASVSGTLLGKTGTQQLAVPDPPGKKNWDGPLWDWEALRSTRFCPRSTNARNPN